MISVIVYGRNDSYGYNLHKRAALSLNCLAEILTAPGDEILFVDYNSPDDVPSFPEAIEDTLTPRAIALLRILRIRPHIHRRYSGRTHLTVLEPVARNAALRRSNPANRWVLSTNTDMIVIPRDGRALSDSAASLPDGYYHLPRFELPQTLWESLDRRDPAGALRRLTAWAPALHLDEIIRAEHDYVLYDGPGDFQLMLRDDLFAIHGFDERIMLGWHVDSNIARRLYLKYGAAGDLAPLLRGYHCEHTRIVTPKHAAGRQADDIADVAGAMETGAIPCQSRSWGLAADTIEESALGQGAAPFIRALTAAIGPPMTAPGELLYASATFGRIGYDPAHVLPFLMDALASFPRDTVLGWFAATPALLALAAAAWRDLGFTHPIRAASAPWLGAPPDGAIAAHPGTIAPTACVFDFAPPDDPAGPALAFVAAGLRRLAVTAPACRIIAVNAVNNPAERLVAAHAGVALSPIATRIRQGFFFPAEGWTHDLLPLLQSGPAGQRAAEGAIAAAGDGLICHTPRLDLLAGRYRLTLDLAAAGTLLIEAVAGRVHLAHCRAPAPGAITFDFTVPFEATQTTLEPEIELLLTGAPLTGTLRAARLERLSLGPETSPREYDWLDLMRTDLGTRSGAHIRAASGASGTIAYGPYCTLAAGEYEILLALSPDAASRFPPGEQAPIRLEAAAGDALLATRAIAPATSGASVWTAPLTLSADRPNLEFRIMSNGALAFTLLSLRTRRI